MQEYTKWFLENLFKFIDYIGNIWVWFCFAYFMRGIWEDRCLPRYKPFWIIGIIIALVIVLFLPSYIYR